MKAYIYFHCRDYHLIKGKRPFNSSKVRKASAVEMNCKLDHLKKGRGIYIYRGLDCLGVFQKIK